MQQTSHEGLVLTLFPEACEHEDKCTEKKKDYIGFMRKWRLSTAHTMQ